ncbi:MAG: hypothetical protein INR62_02045 [Rhodospirillales bacterium]|nr:hypothetical protein [Acetobacter sp.]
MALNEFPPLPMPQTSFVPKPLSNGHLSDPRRLANGGARSLLEWIKVSSPVPAPNQAVSGNGTSNHGFPGGVQANRDQPFDQPRRYSPSLLKSFSTVGASRISFKPLQQWEGVVLEVTPDSFIARLTDGRDSKVVEEAEIDLQEVSPEDLELIQEGAVFYWKIQYQDRPSRQRISDIRFRRLPDWTPEQTALADQEAARVCELIGWK